jgi:hypothetical protein
VTTTSTAVSTPSTLGAVTGTPRRWLRVEGLAVLVAGAGIYLVAVSMVGYLAGPKVGALVYNLAHNQATGLMVLGAGVVSGVSPLVLAGAVLVGHAGMDRLAGYGLKYPSAFGDTHLGRIGR